MVLITRAKGKNSECQPTMRIYTLLCECLCENALTCTNRTPSADRPTRIQFMMEKRTTSTMYDSKKIVCQGSSGLVAQLFPLLPHVPPLLFVLFPFFRRPHDPIRPPPRSSVIVCLSFHHPWSFVDLFSHLVFLPLPSRPPLHHP